MEATLVEKIIAAHCGREHVLQGEEVQVAPDLVVLNEFQAEQAVEALAGGPEAAPAARDLLVIVADRFTAAAASERAGLSGRLREALARRGLSACAGAARGGSLAVELLDQGLATPGGIVLGGGPHLFACGAVACLGLDAQPAEIAAALQGGGARLAVPPSSRWRFAGAPGRWCSGTDLILHALAALGAEAARGSAVELCGPALERLFLVERLAMSVLAGHGGAAAAFCYPDEAALAWLRARSTRTLKPLLPDSGAAYRDARDIDVDDLEPMAAPARALCTGRRLSELPEIPLDQVVIGGGSGGRIEDLRLVARLLKEHGVHAGVRLLVIPGNQRAFQHAVDEGCAASLLRCGALVAAPTCGLWDDPQLTTLGGAERCLATSVAGCPAASLAPQAEVYVASPAVAAASAVLGRIAHPDEVLRSRREAV